MEWQAATFSGIDWHGGEEGSQNTSSKYKFFKVLLVFVINGCNLVARLNNYRASMDAGLSTNAGPNINADGSMDADMDPGSSGLQPIDRIRLWVGLTPDQFTDLEKKGKASPPQGDRFGLRLEPIPALLRAHLFQGGDYHAKQFIAVQVEFTAIGYLTLEINKILADPHCFLGLGLANRTHVSMG